MTERPPESGRRDPVRRVDPHGAHRPRYVVWELTLRCDLACRHCGSRAGLPRSAELSVDEARGVVAQLADLGAVEVAFIGGEAYLHPGWLDIVRAVADAGIRPTMTTGARAIDAALAARMADAGLQAASVSVDGLQATHDALRAVPGSFRAAIAALGHLSDAGIEPYANTQWNRRNLPEVEGLADVLLAAGIRAWQVQLTGPMGRAADRPELLLQPFEMLELIPRLAAVARRARARGCLVEAGNNLGYFGPHEHLLRREHWRGCAAGKHVLGIEANGDVKACPSLPSAPYVGGNLRDDRLATIWDRRTLGFARDDRTAELWGRCAGCYYAATCQGGCSWTSHVTLGRRGNMPWCFHRADMLRAEGRRERLVQVEAAPGAPFDFGRFELVEEAWEGPPAIGT
ncbi:MAG: radical SAM protein [Alphaproteobacteria bacterium]|nr:radical SAM protein [Alphaproteobacteria bacterium]